MNTKTNRHYRQTHQAISDTVLELMSKKSLKNITVTEICKTIGINRGTFYDLFTDIQEVIEQRERMMAEELGEHFGTGLEISNRTAFVEMFKYVQQNSQFYSLYLAENKTLTLFRKMSLKDIEIKGETLRKSVEKLTEVEKLYLGELFRSNMRALLRFWISRDFQETPDELYDILKTQYINYLPKRQD
ncbi:MAG: TetR/AcrR family transcriptional regulator C-terminal domain-containing protein [Eggerthellaceae bacterium]|nr:TetR/AcrR family transcriptional regulator C-terminal domain-containing protein [Eggerthellaceae bacterium]